MPLARASELDRVLECAGSLILPREPFFPTIGSPADWGNRVHSWAETGKVTDDPLGNALHKRIEASGINREALWPAEGVHELALALNVHTREVRKCVLPHPLPQAYKSVRGYVEAWKAAFDLNWVVGTLDYGRPLMESYWIDDLKTGKAVHWKTYEAQQSFYCAAYSLLLYGDLRGGRSTLTHWPRYPIGAPARRFGFYLESDYLELFCQKLLQLHHKVVAMRGGEPGFVTGEHCIYCPSQGWCEAL